MATLPRQIAVGGTTHAVGWRVRAVRVHALGARGTGCLAACDAAGGGGSGCALDALRLGTRAAHARLRGRSALARQVWRAGFFCARRELR
eukprot:1500998-Pleurochrysis_carterae.AAC.1